MLLVVDTNIIVSAIKTKDENSMSLRLMQEIMTGKHTMCVSDEILDEYEDVLHRSSLQLSAHKVDRFLAWIRLNSCVINPRPTTQKEVEMRGDETDRKFFDVAKCLNAKLVTKNYRHYPVHELITIVDEFF